MKAGLNSRIRELQQQMDSSSHISDCHNTENPLQAIVDNLTAKKLEMEAKLAEITEKALITEAELQ